MKESIPKLADKKGFFMTRYIHVQNILWWIEFYRDSIDGKCKRFAGYKKLSEAEKDARDWLNKEGLKL